LSDIASAFAAQRAHKWTVKNSTAAERKAKLLRLKEAILANANAIKKALQADLRKPEAEVAGEIGSVESDIDDALEHLEKWMAPSEVVPAPMFGPTAKARIVYEGRGVCLVFGPWHFPFQLLFEPLVPVIAAGDTALVKPNELLALPVDHVFFTGSPKIGRVVMGAAARNLASVTLELGGKCPVVLDDTTDLAVAAATIAAARCYNAGQVCLCPDVAWVPAARRDELVAKISEAIRAMLYRDGKLDKAPSRAEAEARCSGSRWPKP